MMPKLPRIKLGKTSLLHPAPVTVQHVVSPLLQSSQLCCLPRPLLLLRLSSLRLLAQQEPLGVWCHPPEWFCHDRVWAEKRGLCSLCACPPLRSVFLGGTDNLKFLARRKRKYQSLLIQSQGCRRVLIQHAQWGRVSVGARRPASLPKPWRLLRQHRSKGLSQLSPPCAC